MDNTTLKAQIDSQITNETNPGSITPAKVGGNIKAVVDYVNQETSIRPVSTGLVADSQYNDTELILSYDINVVETATPSDHACKLPQPVTGKTVRLINNSSRVILVYPSNQGGKIGNNDIDKPVAIPSDGKVYEFVCIVNPAPGTWSLANPPATKTITIDEIYIDHVNGVMSNKVGITQANLEAAAGIGLDGNGNILLNGEWRSEDVSTTLFNVRCESNVVADDLFDEYLPSRIAASIMSGYKTADNSATSGDRHSFAFMKPTFYNGYVAPVGVLSTPPNIGDTATLWDEEKAYSVLSNEQLGTGGPFSRYFYTFAYNIPANADTKRYKFKWTIDVIQ